MIRRLFLTLIALIITLLLNASRGETQYHPQINPRSLFTFSQERGQIRFTLVDGAGSLVKEMRLEIYSFNGGKVFDSGAVGNQPIVWRLQEQTGAAAPDGKYLCSIKFKLDGGESAVEFGRLTKSAERVSFIDAHRLYMGSPANDAREFFKRLTVSCPDDASAWLWYGQTMCKPAEIIFNPSVALPPPPLPPPPPPPPPSKNKNAGDKKRRAGALKAGPAPSESDLGEALMALQKAIDLAEDCKTKDQALAHLALAYDQLGAEAEWIESSLRRAESECATNEVKVSSYYSLGVKHWECAYSLSTAYMDRNKFSDEPFHYRNFTNPADKRKFDDCLTKGFEFIEKTLAVNPEYVEAIFYKGLLCREKQKASEDEAERGRWAEEAIKLADKGTDILRRKEGRQ